MNKCNKADQQDKPFEEVLTASVWSLYR